MNLNLINQSSVRMPRAYISECCHFVEKELQKKREYSLKQNFILKEKELSIIFLNKIPAKKLNFQYRKKPYATDVLSFGIDQEIEPNQLGELVLCPQVILKQSKEHDLTFRLELAYMLIHGILHLLGYDHEDSPARASEMFDLQDRIYQKYLGR